MINDSVRYDPNWWNLGCAFNWRGDGYLFNATKKYTPHCSLKVKIYSRDSILVDGAIVYIFGGHQPVNWYACFQTTNKKGEAYFILGDTNSYDCQIVSPIGEIPYTRIINFAQAGNYYEREFYLNGDMPKLFVKDTFISPVERYKLEINFQVDNEIITGNNPDDNSKYSYKTPFGETDFFITDYQNFQRFLRDDTFYSYLTKKKVYSFDTSFIFPNLDEYYIIFSNKEKINNPIEMAINLFLYKKEVGISEKEFNIFSFPVVLKKKDLFKAFIKNNLLIYNTCGAREKELKENKIYFIIFKNNGRISKKKIIL